MVLVLGQQLCLWWWLFWLLPRHWGSESWGNVWRKRGMDSFGCRGMTWIIHKLRPFSGWKAWRALKAGKLRELVGTQSEFDWDWKNQMGTVYIEGPTRSSLDFFYETILSSSLDSKWWRGRQETNPIPEWLIISSTLPETNSSHLKHWDWFRWGLPFLGARPPTWNDSKVPNWWSSQSLRHCSIRLGC